MPLPVEGMQWPPAERVNAYERFGPWAAWYSADPEKLAAAYSGSLSTLDDPKQLSSPSSMLALRNTDRFFWGYRPPAEGHAMRRARLHIPAPGDMAAASADLVYGEVPKLRPAADVALSSAATAGDSPGLIRGASPTQQLLDKLLDVGGFHPALMEGAEICAAYSGSYRRLGWDKEIADHILLDSISPDQAVPEWRSGRLAAVTFWRELGEPDSAATWRHLERHEVDGGKGRIWHFLFKGSAGNLGKQHKLEDHPETAIFAKLVNDQGGWVATGADRLSVEFVPNMKPAKALAGTWYGRSDFEAAIGAFDALDEIWTSLLRDFRLGKGRAVVPDSYMQSNGRGKGSTWDPEQEVYAYVEALPSTEGISLEVVQFAIRVAEHLDAAKALLNIAIRSGGYSGQTFGEGPEGEAVTATEVNLRDNRSNRTRLRKVGYERPALARLMPVAVQMQSHHFGTSGLDLGPINVEFPDGVANSPETNGRALQLLHAAESVSLYTRVKMLNPDWDEPSIKAEVARIRDDQRHAIEIQTPPEPPGSAMAGLDRKPANALAKGDKEKT